MTKKYNQPEVHIEQITDLFLMQAVSAAGGSGAGKINTGIPTDDQW